MKLVSGYVMCRECESKWSETLRSETLDLFGFVMQGDGWGEKRPWGNALSGEI